MNKDRDNPSELLDKLIRCFKPFRKKKFTARQKQFLRPIAEIIAVIDGNAFFGMTVDDYGEDTWYEQYLPAAWAIYKFSGGENGWISQVSWIKALDHENQSVKDAFEQWQLLKSLSKKC
jgi:hypothetical protein